MKLVRRATDVDGFVTLAPYVEFSETLEEERDRWIEARQQEAWQQQDQDDEYINEVTNENY